MIIIGKMQSIAGSALDTFVERIVHVYLTHVLKRDSNYGVEHDKRLLVANKQWFQYISLKINQNTLIYCKLTRIFIKKVRGV